MSERTVVMMDDEFGTEVWNETGGEVGNAEVARAMQSQHGRLWAAMGSWIQNTQPRKTGLSGQNRQGGIFERDRYVNPTNIFDQMKLAYEAVEQDDIVSGVADTTESLAFSRVSMYAEDPDDQDIYNQIAADIELDARLREMWRELFTVSQFYGAVWWHQKEYKVRVKSDKGRRRKKTVSVRCPKAVTLLDPLKIIPVGLPMFNQEKLAWIATREEMSNFTERRTEDEIMNRLAVGKYEPDEEERKWMVELGIDPNRLLLLNNAIVFRHSLTRPQFKRFSDIRMRSVFELLDLKQQLKQMDRAHLIGGPLRVDQRIATPDGWKPIGAAQVGDKVFSVDGKPTEIIGVFPQGVLPMYRVSFTDGAHVFCDDSHPWTVSDRRGRQRTIPLSTILDEGLTDTNGRGKRVHRHRISIAAPLELPEADLALDPYLVGYLIGDGSLTQTIPKITSAEPTDQPWRDVLPAGVTVSQYEKRPGFCPQYGLKGSKWRHNAVTEGLRSIGLWGVVDEDKFIPDEYLWASVGQRWALLQGLCDSDGHSHQAGGVEFSTVSEKLAAGVIHLAQSLGGVAKVTERVPMKGAQRFVATFVERHDGPTVRVESFTSHAEMVERVEAVARDEGLGARMTPRDRGGERSLYRVWISLHQEEAPFRLTRKVASWRPRRYRYIRAISSVTRVQDAEAVCIKTARDDGLFLTEGMLVTHNTNFIVVITKGSDQHPAKPEEIANLQAQVRVVARVPVLVGDHRLNVEIITPKLDMTLEPKRYNGIDARLTGRLYQMFVLGNFCQSADTEILTADGWKTHGAVCPGDVVLTLDTASGLSAWQPCSAVNRFDWDGPLTQIDMRGHSSLSTLNHRWWVRRKLGNGLPGHVWEFRRTDQLNDWCSIPLAAPHGDFPVEPKYSDDLVELVAWFWTEGWMRQSSAGVGIAQSELANPANCARIRGVLKSLLGSVGWSERTYNGCTTFDIHAAYGRFVRELVPDKVPTPGFLRSLTKSQLSMFIDISVAADGHVEPGGKVMFAQKDPRRADVFQMACSLAGIPTSSIFDGELYRITLRTAMFVSPHRSSRNPGSKVVINPEFHYVGVVWCPTTPNGTWLARRNGHVYWTGNSAGSSGDDSVKLVKVVARGMESRRHMLRRTIEHTLLDPMFTFNEELQTEPKLMFHPRAIALDFDQAFASWLLDLREAHEVSRDTILSQFDLNQGHEARMLEREKEEYDDIFQTINPNNQPLPRGGQQQPGGAPPNNGGGDRRNPGGPTRSDQRRAARRGGAAPGSGQGQAPRRARQTAAEENDFEGED